MERATLRLRNGQNLACALAPDAAALRELGDCLRNPPQAHGKALRVQDAEGRAVEVPMTEIAGIELKPPFVLIPNFLTPEEIERVLAYALARESEFTDATISLPYTPQNADDRLRRAHLLNNVQELLPMILPKLRGLVPRLLSRLWPQQEMDPRRFSKIECQLTAHGDGDFFAAHTDDGAPDIANRRLSYVYYFHREPKQFTGGALRLYDTLIEGASSARGRAAFDFNPQRNSLMVFPSDIHHEVTSIRCSSTALADQRLTLNGWLLE